MLQLRYLLFISSIFFLPGCNSDKPFLEKYYNDNLKLHGDIQDSLVAFCKRNETKGYLIRNAAVSKDIRFYIFFKDIPGYTPIMYDSALQRHDYDSTRTSSFFVPASLVENFNRSVYHFISFENNQVFFAYKQDDEIFARDVTYTGILTPVTEDQISKESKKISANAIITSRYLP